MRCDLCRGQMKKQSVRYVLLYENRFVIVENVPANVCQQCGEKLFAPDIVGQLQDIVLKNQRPVKTIEAPVYDLQAVGVGK